MHGQFWEYDSADGTGLARGPDRNLPDLLRWLAAEPLMTYRNFPKLSDLGIHETPETV
jgi:hypothetical protein